MPSDDQKKSCENKACYRCLVPIEVIETIEELLDAQVGLTMKQYNVLTNFVTDAYCAPTTDRD